MALINVDKEKCNGCGICTKDCPFNVIEIKNGYPESKWESCIACGHCVAVCPNSAIDHSLSPLSGQMKINSELNITAEQAEQFLRSRRSVRWFKDTPVLKDDLMKILNMGRYAPTARNYQGITYLVINNKDVLKKITAACVESLEKTYEDPQADISDEQVRERLKSYRETGLDIILLDAPCLVLLLTDRGNAFGARNSAILYLIYSMLYAPTINVATCWAGFVEVVAAAKHQPLLELLDIPENMKVSGAMMVGYPMYEHKRLVDREPLNVLWQEGY